MTCAPNIRLNDTALKTHPKQMEQERNMNASAPAKAASVGALVVAIGASFGYGSPAWDYIPLVRPPHGRWSCPAYCDARMCVCRYNTGYAINPARDLPPRAFIWFAGWSDAFTAGNNWWCNPCCCSSTSTSTSSTSTSRRRRRSCGGGGGGSRLISEKKKDCNDCDHTTRHCNTALR